MGRKRGIAAHAWWFALLVMGCGGTATVDSGGSSDAGGGSVDLGDASVRYDAAPSGLAGFALVVNGVVQTPMSCASENWQFPPAFSTSGRDAGCRMDPDHPGCSGVNSVYLVNTGQVPVAYYATNMWSGGYVPGVLTGAKFELAGVMQPGAAADITSVFDGGVTALLGSSEPFSGAAGKYVFDEGTIPWPRGVSGSNGASTMHVAEIEMYASCTKCSQQW